MKLLVEQPVSSTCKAKIKNTQRPFHIDQKLILIDYDGSAKERKKWTMSKSKNSSRNFVASTQSILNSVINYEREMKSKNEMLHLESRMIFLRNALDGI